jgi:tetratricopeptide (TPR) repeat protein
MTVPIDFKYRAFLSYSHADTPLAQWLHPRLERFPLRDLAGRATPLGPVPRALRPIFRDRDDFSAGRSLNAQTLAALDASAALIVLCSPAAAQSHYVNEEIRLFKQRCPGRPIVPVIAAGKPDGGDEECFPPALRFALDEAGQVTDRPAAMPLAADVREHGDGRDLALAKTVAALIGVPSDEVYRRAERERKRQARIKSAVASTIALLVCGAAAFLYLSQKRGAILIDTAAACGRYLPEKQAVAAGPLNALEQCIKTLEAMQKGAASDPRDAEILHLIGAGRKEDAERLQVEAAQDDEAAMVARGKKAAERYRGIAATAGLGDRKKAREYYAKAAKLDPDDHKGAFWHAYLEQLAGNLAEAERVYTSLDAIGGSYHEFFAVKLGLGDIRIARGDLSGALNEYRKGVDDLEQLVKASSDNDAFQRELGTAYTRVGDVLKAQGNLAEALKYFRDGLTIADRLAKIYANNAIWQSDLAISDSRVGDVYFARGNLPEALKSFQDGLDIRDRLAKADPDNASWQSYLSESYDRVGDVLYAQGKPSEALKSFQDSLSIRDRLAKADPDDADWRHTLTVSQHKAGDVLIAQGRLPEALKSFRDSFAIAERLVKTDPNNALWQRDLSTSQGKVAIALEAQGNLAEALDGFRRTLESQDRLAKTDPRNAEWQLDVSSAHERIGLVLFAQQKLPEALQSFQASLAIRDHLVKTDPGNLNWRRGLPGLYIRSGDVLVAQGNLPEALKSFQSGLAIARLLVETDPGDMRSQHDRVVFYERIGDVLLSQGNLTEAMTSFQSGLAIARLLAKTDPGNAGWQTGLSTSYDRVGYVLRAQGNLLEASKTLQSALTIRERLAETDPGNADRQFALSVSYELLGDVLVAEGNLQEALKVIQSSLAIRERLTKTDPGITQWQWQRGTAISHGELAELYRRQGETALAKEALVSGKAIMERLTRLSPDNAVWKQDLALFEERLAALENDKVRAEITAALAEVTAAWQAGDFAKAAALQVDVAGAVEKVETDKDGKPGLLTARIQGMLSWHSLYAHEFGRALAASERALELAPDEIWIATNRAHALMFLGRAKEARAAYLEHKGKEVAGPDVWENAILKDFAEFEKRGLTHPQMAEIRRLLAPAAAPPQH